MNFTPTQEQEKAFKRVENAIKNAQKLGLVFYGKSGNLVAYRKEADDYVDNYGFDNCLGNGYPQIPNISVSGLIKDSGADDYPSFISESDKEEFS